MQLSYDMFFRTIEVTFYDLEAPRKVCLEVSFPVIKHVSGSTEIMITANCN